jgi:hypothetical protein
MFIKIVSTVPDRSALRTLYDQAIDEISTSRNGILTTNFYAKTGDAIFNAGYLALSDAVTGTRRMHTVSAPAGAGKTSFAYALIAAVHRYTETTSDAPYGIVFVVDQIEKADKVYCDLSALVPGKVAIWTRDHDTHCKKPERVENPAARFVAEELRHYPIIVVTHKGVLGQRALTIVDERPDEAPSLDLMLSEAEAVREALLPQCPDTKNT